MQSKKTKSAMDLHNEMNWRMISGNVQWNESKINCIASERQARPIVDSAKTALSESDSRQEKKLYRMHVEKSPLKINEKQTYFNEKHKKTTTLKKQLIWPFNRENLTLTWTKFLFCSSGDIVPSAFTTTANPRSSRSSVSARVIFLCLGIVHWFYSVSHRIRKHVIFFYFIGEKHIEFWRLKYFWWRNRGSTLFIFIRFNRKEYTVCSSVRCSHPSSNRENKILFVLFYL